MTSDGDALFRAVCENPADDTPRLVYADWLQENGRPERAEFIRLQCEAWNLCPDYPDETARRVRASELLRTFGDRWYGELPAVPGVEWGALFVRGFVDTAWVEAEAAVVAQILPLFTQSPLSHLTVRYLSLSGLEEVLRLECLARLASLTLEYPMRSDAIAMSLAEARRRFPKTVIRGVQVQEPRVTLPQLLPRPPGTASTAPS